MSMISLVRQSSTPATPTVNKSRLFINSGGTLSSVDDVGIVTTYGAGITQEQVEDYIGGLITDTASINATYNDAGNILFFDVLPGGVDHDSLLNFVANKHIDHSAVSITAGTGLSGGGDITASRTLSIANTGVTAGSYQAVTVNAQGQVTAGTNPTTLSGYGITDAQPLDSDLTAVAGLAGTGFISRTGTGTAVTRTITAGTGISVTNGDGISGNPTIDSTITQYTDELAQDAVGTILTDTSSINFTYNDAGNQITADVLPAGVDHNSLLNFVANKHIDHSAVSITAGTGLSGGGDITSTRTISMPNVGTAGTYGAVNNFPVITTDAQGRVSAVTVNNVTSGLLTGLSLASDADIIATDTILQALGKLQAISNHWTELLNVTQLTNNSNVTVTTIPNLGFPVTTGRRYRIEAHIRFASAAATTGIGLSLNTSDTATGTIAGSVDIPLAADGTGAIYSGAITSLGDLVISTAVPANNTDYLATISASFTCTASGTIVPVFRSEVNGSTVTVQIGSNILVRDFA